MKCGIIYGVNGKEGEKMLNKENDDRFLQVDNNIFLLKNDEKYWKLAYNWYQDLEILKYSEGVSGGYDIETINRMYKYLDSLGELFFIAYKDDGDFKIIGDVTLSEMNMPIVIGEKDYWGKGIGSKVIEKLIGRAREKGMKEIYVPQIYSFNYGSKRIFEKNGFIEVYRSEEFSSYMIKF